MICKLCDSAPPVLLRSLILRFDKWNNLDTVRHTRHPHSLGHNTGQPAGATFCSPVFPLRGPHQRRGLPPLCLLESILRHQLGQGHSEGVRGAPHDRKPPGCTASCRRRPASSARARHSGGSGRARAAWGGLPREWLTTPCSGSSSPFPGPYKPEKINIFTKTSRGYTIIISSLPPHSPFEHTSILSPSPASGPPKNLFFTISLVTVPPSYQEMKLNTSSPLYIA